LNVDEWGFLLEPVELGKPLVFKADGRRGLGLLYTLSFVLPKDAILLGFSFEDAVKEQFGKALEELPPAERGRLRAESFEQGVLIKFLLAPDIKCTLASAPFF
jgi:hypothetical protein